MSSKFRPKSKSDSSKGFEMSDKSFQLNKNRFVSVSEFRNQVRVDIREYYFDDSGDRKPGKKGINLSIEEWNKLVNHLPQIQKAIKGIDDSDDNQSEEDVKPKREPKQQEKPEKGSKKQKKSDSDESDSDSDSNKKSNKKSKNSDSDEDSDDKHKSKKPKTVLSDSDSD